MINNTTTAPWTAKDKAAEQAYEMGGGLGLDSQRADLDDPRGYGNFFTSLWTWLKKKNSKNIKDFSNHGVE
jgi:hypothetical protein